MKNRYGFLVGSVLAFSWFSFSDPQSTGAPASHTGAPGELTCMKSGCHDDNAINSNNAECKITISENAENYIPGKSYTINVSISESNINRFGFEAVCLRNSDNKNAGSITITDAVRTQVIKNTNNFPDRDYATYTYYGTEPFSPGLGQWSFDWTAPQADEGPVTFYVAAISANDDGTDNGDFTFVNSLTLNPDITSSSIGISDNRRVVNVAFLAHNTLKINFNERENCAFEVRLFDLMGRETDEFRGIACGDSEQYFLLNGNYHSGIYLVVVNVNNKVFVRKIF